ncbi:MAG: hypothetical protein P1V36_01680 [Planctomycetota bacterium]|nr:hypothetical protein [Planctomycetota bacterium]
MGERRTYTAVIEVAITVEDIWDNEEPLPSGHETLAKWLEYTGDSLIDYKEITETYGGDFDFAVEVRIQTAHLLDIDDGE